MTTETVSANRNDRCYIIHTDGACRINPGPGGWGAIIQLDVGGQIVEERELSGATANVTTNNRMELSAAVGALKRLTEKTIPITVRSDSKYLVDAMSSWLKVWKQNGWRNSSKKPVLNMDLWQELDQLCETLGPISWVWVKGHSGDPMNDRCDRIANLAIDKELKTSKAA